MTTFPPFKSKTVPVIVITDVAQAVPMAHALLAGGIDVMEITLRHPAGLPAIAAVAKAVPQMCVGAAQMWPKSSTLALRLHCHRG